MIIKTIRLLLDYDEKNETKKKNHTYTPAQIELCGMQRALNGIGVLEVAFLV